MTCHIVRKCVCVEVLQNILEEARRNDIVEHVLSQIWFDLEYTEDSVLKRVKVLIVSQPLTSLRFAFQYQPVDDITTPVDNRPGLPRLGAQLKL